MIIHSLLDTDLYKITMAQFAFHQFPNAEAEYKFVCRSDVDLRPYLKEIQEELNLLDTLSFTPNEISYLRTLGLFEDDFLSYLSKMEMNPSQLILENKENLVIKAKGRWCESIFWEIYVLSIVNEVYFRNKKIKDYEQVGMTKLLDKISLIKESKKQGIDLKIIEFGTRRRFSSDWQRKVLEKIKQEVPENLIGTSNVLLAKKLNLKPIGTLAHELLQAGQVLSDDLLHFQSFVLEKWIKEYHGKLGITLTDVITTDSFLKDFNKNLTSLYEGVRHDSGDPLIWTDKIIKHFESLNINPKNKKLIFSDGLDIKKCIEIYKYVNGRSQVSFGIGTNLTNDVGVQSINIVMKLVEMNGKPVAKISDEPKKAICESPRFLSDLKKMFNVK